MFQDDLYLLYAPTATVSRTLDTLKSLGVDRLRLTILWSAIAPDPSSIIRPSGFDASNPAAYPASAWSGYDRIVRLAVARGIGVSFDVTAPGPLWAMARPAPDAKSATHYKPSALEFGDFVAAIGRRYSGTYVQPGLSAPLPRVSYWSIWNEPNQPGWLAPQWGLVHGHAVMVSPWLYREYVDSAYAALARTGHRPSTDTILIGELAPEGSERTRVADPIPPMPFLRAVYCLDASYRPLQGGAARTLNCPPQTSPSTFVSAHPGLFAPSGFAHHPYSFFLAPNVEMANPDFAPLSNLSRLEQGLDSIFTAYGVHRQLPLYLTEYGYETNPPNPYRGINPAEQALYLDEAEYLAWRDARVRSLSQFLLYDSAPNRSYAPGTPGYWSSFQTGLLYENGGQKPAFNSFRLPVYVPQPVFSRGAEILIWAMLRLAPNGTKQRAQIQWRGPTGGYLTLKTLTTSDPSGFVTGRVGLPGTGAVRVAWVSAAGQVVYSRAVGVQARGG
jgi:hypothetical protein